MSQEQESFDLGNIPAPKLTLDAVEVNDFADSSLDEDIVTSDAEEVVEVAKATEPTKNIESTKTADNASQNASEIQSLEETLTSEEIAQVEAFSKSIDISNSQQVIQYGSGAQKKMADFSETALTKVRTQDLGEIGDLISSVVVELRGFGEEETKGFLGFFKKQSNKIASLKARYDKAEANVDKIVKALETHQIGLMKDSAMFDQLYQLNLTYFKEITMYLLAGKKRLAEFRENELKDAYAKAKASGRTEDAEAVQKMEAACNRFEKKLSDLALTRVVSLQMAPQIRLLQNNEMLMIEKIQTTVVNTIPLWKSQMVLALGLANTEEALAAQTTVTELTNDLLRKNSEKLKQSTIEVARESERGVVEVETLRATNNNLIETFDEVMRIQKEGREKRAAAEVEIRKMEAELKQKLLEQQPNVD